jgi:cell wall-associated NlpC family hydrolase
MEGASHQSARQFGWVPQTATASQQPLDYTTTSFLQDDAELMNPWAETTVATVADQEHGYWVPYRQDLPPTIIRRRKKVAPIHVSSKLKYPMMVALTVATIGSGGVLQAFSPAGAKAAPSNNGDGTGSFQPVDDSEATDEILAAPTSDGSATHSVQPGDTLRGIAAEYGVDVSTLVSANGLANPDLIYPGDQIHIPGDASFLDAMVTYTVQPGDSLREIATAHGVSVTAIINYEANGITNPDLIYAGQEITIPGGTAPVASEPVAEPQAEPVAEVASDPEPAPEPEPAPAPEPEPQPEGIYIDVQTGDTLGLIAERHGVDVQAIVGWGPNGISNPDALSVGQTLFIPGGVEAAPEPAPAPEPVVQQQSEPEPAPEPQPEPEPAPEPAPEPQPEPEPEPQVQAQPEPEPQQQAQPAPASSAGQQIVDLAMQFQGAPYVWGATGPSSFDCTGYTYYIVNQVIGGGFPRDMHGQASFGTPVSPDNLQPGDIVFQQNTYQPGLSHAGIYIGNGQFINAANESVGVTISNLWDSYWGPRYHSAVRIQ